MTKLAVWDASALVTLLLDPGPDGEWAAVQFARSDVAGPALVDFEVSNVIRRRERAGQVSADQAAQAHADLLDLRIERWAYQPLSRRVRELRENLTSYDASYVAVAELLDVPLITLDRRLSRAPGLKCAVLTP